MRKLIYVIPALLFLWGCAAPVEQDHYLDPNNPGELIPIVEPLVIPPAEEVIDETKPIPFKAGKPVKPPVGCVEGRLNGVDC